MQEIKIYRSIYITTMTTSSEETLIYIDFVTSDVIKLIIGELMNMLIAMNGILPSHRHTCSARKI